MDPSPKYSRLPEIPPKKWAYLC